MKIAGSLCAGVLLASQAHADPIRVVTKAAPPFISATSSGNWHGPIVDLWEAVAREAHLEYVWVKEPTAERLLLALEHGEADVAVSPLTITAERETRVDFTQPFYSSGLGVAVSRTRQTLDWIRLLPLVRSIVYVVGAIVVAAGIFKVVERKQGWSWTDAIHFANTSATSTGYGNFIPQTALGKHLSNLWQWIGIAAFGVGIAAGTAVLTASSSVHVTVEDLHTMKVGTVGSTSAARFLDSRGITWTDGKLLPALLDDIVDGHLDAVVYDEPMLHHLVAERGLPIEVVGGFTHEAYGFALPEGSPLTETVNRALLHVLQTGAWAPPTTGRREGRS